VRWYIFSDIGKFGGLARRWTSRSAYAIRTPHDGAEMTPCVLAGPTCDFRRRHVREDAVPASGDARDRRQAAVEGTGAYTSTYSSVAFNGFPPLRKLPHLRPSSGA